MNTSPESYAALQAAFDGARVLVTGGCGFIAGHLTNALMNLGSKVILVDERPYTGGAAGQNIPVLFQMSVGSEAFGQFLQRESAFDYVFHLSARAYAADSVNAPYVDFNANLIATVNLLEQLRFLPVRPRLVFASSAAVYGNPSKLPIEEHDPTIPVSPYGVSKLAAERYVAVYARLYDMPMASLRLFSVYGPHQTKQVVFDLFKKLRASPDNLVVLGDGTQVRDFVYVKDVVRAFLTVAVRGRSDGFAYNVASGVGISMAQLAQQIVAIQEPGATITFTGKTRPGDPERWLGSNAELAALGGEPRYTFQEGIAETAEWFSSTFPSVTEKEVAA